jgi:hypothetical protein
VATVVEFSGESLRVSIAFNTGKLLELNLKEFKEERRVEHLVPNQILTSIARCGRPSLISLIF